DRDGNVLRNACTHDDGIHLAHRELEFVNLADVVLHGRLHQKAAETEIEQRDRYVERSDNALDAAEDLNAWITSSFGGWAHGHGFYPCPDQLHIYLTRNMCNRTPDHRTHTLAKRHRST